MLPDCHLSQPNDVRKNTSWSQEDYTKLVLNTLKITGIGIIRGNIL